VIKRTIKPAAAASRISPAAAKSAARVVYRDSQTGKFVVSGYAVPDAAGARAYKPYKRSGGIKTASPAKRRSRSATKKR
jgi:hypothetical protein